MIEFLTKHLDLLITGAITGALGWIFRRKREKAETSKVESDVLASIQANYATLVKDMKENKQEQDMKIESLTKKVIQLEAEVDEWKAKYHRQKEEMEMLRNGVNTTSNNGKE